MLIVEICNYYNPNLLTFCNWYKLKRGTSYLLFEHTLLFSIHSIVTHQHLLYFHKFQDRQIYHGCCCFMYCTWMNWFYGCSSDHIQADWLHQGALYPGWHDSEQPLQGCLLVHWARDKWLTYWFLHDHFIGANNVDNMVTNMEECLEGTNYVGEKKL